MNQTADASTGIKGSSPVLKYSGIRTEIKDAGMPMLVALILMLMIGYGFKEFCFRWEQEIIGADGGNTPVDLQMNEITRNVGWNEMIEKTECLTSQHKM
jgi:hypothetical protein